MGQRKGMWRVTNRSQVEEDTEELMHEQEVRESKVRVWVTCIMTAAYTCRREWARRRADARGPDRSRD